MMQATKPTLLDTIPSIVFKIDEHNKVEELSRAQAILEVARLRGDGRISAARSIARGDVMVDRYRYSTTDPR